MGLLVRLFTLALKARDEVRIAWELAQAEVRPYGSTPGICRCGYGLDDHEEDLSCPISFFDDDDEWVVMLDEDEEEDE